MLMLAPNALLQDRYRVIRQLGKGGMGAVYEAVDLRLDAIVALKETFSTDARLRRQFEQEARLLAGLNHPALPRVSDYFTEGDRAFLVMQFIAGADLATIMCQQPGPFPLTQVIAWADQLLDALIYLHTRDRQIIHRDIKPHNLKVTANGQIALLDFGLAKTQTTDLSGGNSSTSIFGYTRRYSPLEQIQDLGTGPQSDIYALGATLYHLLTGIKPPDALTRAGALANSNSDPLRPANEVQSVVSPEIAAILCRAMAVNAADRYADASEFRGALRQVGREDPPATKMIANPSRAGSRVLNATVIAKAPGALFDPFDSYSILKPDTTNWLVPKQGRHPGIIAAVLAIVFSVGAGAFYASGRWFNSKASSSDFVKASSRSSSTGTAVVRQDNADSSRGKPGGAKSTTTSSVETIRKIETPKRRTPLPTTAHTKTASVKPPVFSIAP
jgi:serine/threonine protein kinase